MTFHPEFSSRAFEANGVNTASSDQLATKLQDQIAREIQSEVVELGRRIKTALNGLGHELTILDSEMDDGRVSVTFADITKGSDRQNHRLRFDLDLIVSVGYPGYVEK